MLASIRKFSNSILAKILLGIIIIPFVFWGMGSSFTSGNRNVILVIDKEKYSTQSFIDFIQKFAPADQKINSGQVEELFSFFIGEKLIEKEIDYFNIKLSDKSLSKLIKSQKEFKRGNEFSRIEYEKFLLRNNSSAAYFEFNLAKNEKKRQLLEFIGGGLFPSKFLVNSSYDKINQKRDIQIINLNSLFKQKYNFTEDQIKSYYENNKNNYKNIYKSVKILELNPKKLTANDEFTDIYFKKIDEIDDLIIQGKNLKYIAEEFNLDGLQELTLNEKGDELNSKTNNSIPKEIVKNIFNIEDIEPTVLVENKNKYFILELLDTKNIQSKLSSDKIRKQILSELQTNIKREILSEIISKINQNNFKKSDFEKLSKEKNLSIKKVTLDSQRDNTILKDEFLKQIYSFPEKKIIVSHDIKLQENFLIYIEKINHMNIDKKSQEYEKYFNLSKIKLASELLNTYDSYIKKKYEMDINYKALDTVKNYFN